MQLEIEPVNIVYCYDPKSKDDQKKRDELDKHVSKIPEVVTKNYYSGLAGSEREKTIRANMASADIILLLESADFQNSADNANLMQIAKTLYANRKAYIVPIMLRPMALDGDEFEGLQVLPHNGESITRWLDKDEAYLDVRTGVRKIVDIIKANRKRDQLLTSAQKHVADAKYEDALQEYQLALSLFPYDPFVDDVTVEKNKADIWCKVADIYCKWEKWQKALDAYRNVVNHDLHNVQAYQAMATLYMQLSDLTQAIEVCNEAILANRQSAELYIQKSMFLWRVGQQKEALALCDGAIEICSDKVAIRKQKGSLLYKSGDYAAACAVYSIALNEDHDDIYLYKEYGDALLGAKRFHEAAEAYRNAIDVYDRSNIRNQAYIDILEKKYIDVQQELSKERRKNRALKNKSNPLDFN